MDSYDPGHISRYFDEFGEKEWSRMTADAAALVSLHIHTRYLEKYLKHGDRVLEAGAGAGRFTLILAKMGVSVTVGDVSLEQLRLNRGRVSEAGLNASVVGWEKLDIVNLSRYPDDAFDSVVCYGGPLSYVFDQADAAFGEMLRVTKPGGYVLMSVMSLAGATRRFLPDIYETYGGSGAKEVRKTILTGDLRDALSPNGHHCRMYLWNNFRQLLERHTCEIVDASASNFLSVQNEDFLERVKNDEEFRKDFLEWEYRFCGQPGALDGGTHIIAVVRKIG